MNFLESNKRRLTKIVCTLGPASASFESINDLAKAGMNIARINVSHGTRKSQEQLIDNVRKVNEKNDFCIAILIDTRGAEIRTGDVQDPLEIKKGDEVIFAPTTLEKSLKASEKIIFVGYDGFSSDVRETDKILIDNGEMSFEILSIEKNGSVLAKAGQSGSIGSRRHINLPGADIDLPSVTEKDWEDIEYAATNNIDFVALSFIRNAEEVQEVRDFLTLKKSNMQIITKVETRKAVKNIVEIIDASDGIMIARGDLGAEVPYEHLPVIQDEIITRCRDAGKPVIVATHMLESMTEHPIPTRAEVTDVAHAAFERTDLTMLSGETASGKHPTVAVDAMDRILRAAETQLLRYPLDKIGIHNESEARAESAVSLAKSSNAKAIMVITKSGQSARFVSRFRPQVPIIPVVPDSDIQRKMQMLYGTFPLCIEFSDIEDTVHDAIGAAKKAALILPGDTIVLVSDTRTKSEAVTSIQIRTI